MSSQQPITTDEQAIELLNDYTGIYYSLSVVQYKLSRQQNKSIKDSLNGAHKKVGDVCISVIEQNKLALSKE